MRHRDRALTSPAALLGGLLLSASVLVSTVLVSTPANADASGWAHVSGGTLGWQTGENDELKASAIMSIDAGMGTSPRADFIFGGYFKLMPVFGHGTDVGLLARLASRGFQTDMIGFAIDAGVFGRAWGEGSSGFIGQAVLGMPLGLQLAGIGMVGHSDSFGFGATLGIDLIRLTVDRRHLLEWWPSPRPIDNTYRSDAGFAGVRF